MQRPPIRLLARLLAPLALATLALAGVRADALFAIVNGSFDNGLNGWMLATNGGGAPFSAASAPDGRSAALVQLAPGAWGRLRKRVPVGMPGDAVESVPAPGDPGEKVEAIARVWLDASVGAGTVTVAIRSWNGVSTTEIARSEPLDVAHAPRGRWLLVRSEALPGLDARVRSDTTELWFDVLVAAAGAVYVDELLAGPHDADEHALANAGFEDDAGATLGWTAVGAVEVTGVADGVAPYRGARCAELPSGAQLRQQVSIDDALSAPWHGERAAAGAWLQVRPGTFLPSGASASVFIEVDLRARPSGGGAPILLARERWKPSAGDQGLWKYIETPAGVVPPNAASVEVRVRSQVGGPVRVDDVQLGEPRAIDGNPRALVAASYVGWFRSPAGIEATGAAATPRGRWGNWAWTDPPACDPDNTSLAHDPDGQLRANGRRDGAVTLLDDARLPLVGLYDSRDADVVRFHVDLARAAGVDVFVYDWMGRALAEQEAPRGESFVNDRTLEVLIDAADRIDCDLKVTVMYEPKVHMFGWVAGPPDLDVRKQGMVEDLIYFVQTHGRRRPIWRQDGELVVFVFWHAAQMPGVGALDDGDWADIEQSVEAATGDRIALCATHPPAAAATPFVAYSPWDLVGTGIRRFATYDDFLAGIEQPTSLADVFGYAYTRTLDARTWAARADHLRAAVGLVWPGFDDSGVAGWSLENGVGSDGLPLCVRAAAHYAPGFLGATFDAALDVGLRRVHVATWNDWNEGTALEPRWDAGFVARADLGLPATRAQVHTVFGPLLALQARAATLKGQVLGLDLSADDLEAVTHAYLEKTRTGAAVLYE